jgi:predicted NAD/FAD-binding protein
LPVSARIGVVGAGASGLALAHALGQTGYRNVTVLEREERVGGKCSTFFHEGRSYELGAGALTSAYGNVRALMAEVGARSTWGLSGQFVDVGNGSATYVPAPLREHPWWQLGAEGARLVATFLGERRLLRPGFAGLSPQLQMPFSEWARARRLQGVARLIEPWFTAFGYGYLDEIPAAYVLKYVSLFRFPVSELLDEGYQGLWERVARQLDVRLGVKVDRVTRGDQVTVDAGPERWTFDALILACPLDGALGFLDASEDERTLFSQILHNDYHVVAAEIEGPPTARYGFFPQHLDRTHAGQLIFWYRRWLESDLVLYYALPPAGQSLETTEATVRATVGRLGGRVRRVHTRRAWRYFPHVTTAAMRAGYYERLEALQGRRRTYYAGELLSFSTVESVVAYARDLIARHFGAG